VSHDPPPPAEEPALLGAVAFSVQEEGETTGVYLSSWTLDALAQALGMPDDARAVVLHGGSQTPLPWALACRLQGDLEVVLWPPEGPMGVAEVPQPLLANPAGALRAGARVAVSVQATGELAVFSDDPGLLGRVLCGFVRAAVVLQAAPQRAEPVLDPALVLPLLSVQEPGVSTRLTLLQASRFWTLEMETAGEGVRSSVTRWVCEGPQGRWRSGWSW
jgi:hypothetical protein